MSIKRFTVSILSALLSFLIGAAFVWLCFFSKQLTLISSGEEKTSPFEVRSSNFSQSEFSKLFDSGKTPAVKSKKIEFPDTYDSRETVAGKLEIIRTDSFEWKITLNGKKIADGKQFTNDDDFPPNIEKQIRSNASPFDEVIVFTHGDGTCCEFERLWFLELKSDGSYRFSNLIDGGFANIPQITTGENYVKLKVRGGFEHNGTSYFRGGQWIFQNGRVRKIK